MKTKLMRLMNFVEGYYKALNEQAFALGIGEELKSIGKKAYEQAKKYWDNLSDNDKEEVANEFYDFFHGIMSKNMDIQKNHVLRRLILILAQKQRKGLCFLCTI